MSEKPNQTQGPLILVVDDEAHQRSILRETLSNQGWIVDEAPDGGAALKRLTEVASIRLVVTDLSMPGLDGVELIRRAKADRPDVDFVMVTAHGTVDSAIRAMKAGAKDYLLKPVEHEELALKIRKILEHQSLEVKASRLERENRSLRREVKPVGGSPGMKKLLDELARVARADATVLLAGETGVGKEVVARAIHAQSSRSKGPFVAVNCSAVPENLIESEYFGYEKGAFTGADRRSEGLFEQADGGTLFLDEIGEMDLKLQPKILRALEERKVRRVAGNMDIPVDIRLVAATHRDLKQLVAEGKFREDLYYRLNVVQLRIPPLRERKEDLPDLVQVLVDRYAKPLNVKVEKIDSEYLQALAAYRFPGNVRELANIVERSMIFMTGGTLAVQCLPGDMNTGTGQAVPTPAIPGTLADRVGEIEKQILAQALTRNQGDVEEVARELSVSKSTLYTKLSKYGLK